MFAVKDFSISILVSNLITLLSSLYANYAKFTEKDVQMLDHESRLFGQQLVRLKQLLSLYLVLTKLHSAREASPDPEDSVLLEVNHGMRLGLKEEKS